MNPHTKPENPKCESESLRNNQRRRCPAGTFWESFGTIGDRGYYFELHSFRLMDGGDPRLGNKKGDRKWNL